MNEQRQRVLTFPSLLLREVSPDDSGNPFQGLIEFGTPFFARTAEAVMNPANLEYRDREEAEKDFTRKQLIPYCVIVASDGLVFRYRRTRKGGESRLHDRFSIGVGGHVEPCDSEGEAGSLGFYRNAMLRELAEETSLEPSLFEDDLVALINDDSDEVGRVHFGTVHVVRLKDRNVTLDLSGDPALRSGVFVTETSLRESGGTLEGWSRLIVDSGILSRFVR